MTRFLRSARNRWWLIGALWVLVGLLGLWGMALAAQQTPELRPWANRLNLTRELFGSGFSNSFGRLNWQLDAARFLGQIVAGITFLQGLLALFGDRIAIARLRRAKGHVVVCGLGDKGSRLAHEFASEGRKVVAVERDPANPLAAGLRERGVLVVTGDATDVELLRRLGVPRANHVVAVCGDDGTNAEIAAAVRLAVEGRTGRPLLCSVHLFDNQLCAALRQQTLRASGGGVRLEFFNVYHRGAAAWLADHPIAGTIEDPAHVAIFGLQALGQELTLAAAQQSLADNGAPDDGHRALRLILVDPEATRRFQALALKHPLLTTAVDVTTIDLDLSLPSADAAHAFRAFLDDEVPAAAFVTYDSDSDALATGLLVRRAFAGPTTRVVVRTRSRSGLAVLLDRGDADSHPIGIDGFALLDRTCRADVVKRGLNEQIAQAIHADYVARQRDSTGGFAQPWSELTSEVRESNRLAADEMANGLAAVGCDLVPIQRWDDDTFTFEPAELDTLAEREHDRWRAERSEAGWTHGPVRDNEAKQNPLLVPWAELGDDAKEANRDATRAIPGLLARAGFEIVRI